MRGGSIPLFLWGTGLIVLLAINAIWTGDSIQIGMFGFAAAVVLMAAGILALRNPEAARRGPPAPADGPEAVPRHSLAAALLGVAVGAMLFGVVFGLFLVLIGAGIWLAALGRLVVEVRAQRASLRGEERQQ